MTKGTKPAIKSLGIWGSLTAIGSILAILKGLPPELLDDTKELLLAFMALVGSLGALIGRWRAALQIDRFF